MFWGVVIIICAAIALSLNYTFGKIVIGATVIAVGLKLLSWITGVSFLVTLAKGCVVIIVVTIVGVILLAIIE